MGTNFFWTEAARPRPDPWSDMDPEFHIGKRSAAGRYCWDCDVTLCVEGADKIATGRATWHSACPKCGKKPEQKGHNAAMVELGFASAANARPAGVTSTAWFTWAQDPERVGAFCDEHLDEQLIEDEYDRPMTCRDFLNMLRANCALQSTDMVGREFS